jgi:hypothetical protein
MLYNLGVITFSPPLESRLRKMEELRSGESYEMQLRAAAIWAVEMLRRQIVSDHPEAKGEVNAVLLDFLLYDLAKEFESTGTLRACGARPCEFMRVPARQPSPPAANQRIEWLASQTSKRRAEHT